jgi:hypothetical protein
MTGAPAARLTRKDAVEIRRRHRQGIITIIELAHEYRVWPSSIRGILTGRSYPETLNVPCPDDLRERIEDRAKSEGATIEECAMGLLRRGL